ncbi:glycoside hydrolase family 26 protein [Actinocorallia sp. A-T 12471]|uniref:glycoside hydrolase family 26 protein n=1 Tax=Actinocorallia sp. A-T 12471 TaxID=3089813 RepID=UPI0029CCF21B|nr:glycosyl hydrolase [Actinocorallia sp. A-T 12471]MDX6744725.1 glycosyl hydrolase [Actinocorallia sp. A-T 12471]
MRKTAAAAALGLLLAGSLSACGTAMSTPPNAKVEVQTAPYDVRPLLRPKNKFLGVTYEGAGTNAKALKKFANAAGKKPNMVALYTDFKEDYPVEKVKGLWDQGIVSLLVWEPFETGLGAIADGSEDDRVVRFARAVRDLDIPLVLSFAHEMNGNWYPWGTKKNEPEDFLAAHRHLHDLFVKEGTTNVIWLWSPNVPSNSGKYKFQPYWPGDAYVDWVGPIGYFEWSNDSRSFDQLFGPSLTALRKFTKRPVLFPETASPPSADKPRYIAELYQAIKSRKDLLGVVWFNLNKEHDWRVQSDTASLTAFREAVADPIFGFDPRKAG